MRLQKFANSAQVPPLVRFMLLGVVALSWLALPKQAGASCGYYVVIGHPSEQTAGEQARMRHEQMPLEQKKTPCNGPQCRGQERPMMPAAATPILMQDPMAMAVISQTSADIDFKCMSLSNCLFVSNPHIWRTDPPPRA